MTRGDTRLESPGVGTPQDQPSSERISIATQEQGDLVTSVGHTRDGHTVTMSRTAELAARKQWVKPSTPLGLDEHLNEHGMRVRNGNLVCQSCGKTAKLGWTYGTFGVVSLATCGRWKCRPSAPWTEAIEFSAPRKVRR